MIVSTSMPEIKYWLEDQNKAILYKLSDRERILSASIRWTNAVKMKCG